MLTELALLGAGAGLSMWGQHSAAGISKSLMREQQKINRADAKWSGLNLPTFNRQGMVSAGFNPILALSQGTASMSHVSQGSLDNPLANINPLDALNTAKDVDLANSTQELQDSQKKQIDTLTKVNADKIKAETEKIKAETDTAKDHSVGLGIGGGGKGGGGLNFSLPKSWFNSAKDFFKRNLKRYDNWVLRKSNEYDDAVAKSGLGKGVSTHSAHEAYDNEHERIWLRSQGAQFNSDNVSRQLGVPYFKTIFVDNKPLVENGFMKNVVDNPQINKPDWFCYHMNKGKVEVLLYKKGRKRPFVFDPARINDSFNFNDVSLPGERVFR